MTIIQFHNVSLIFPHTTCFSKFNGSIHCRQRIAIVGDNGNGKTSLLRILRGELAPSEGNVRITPDLQIGYVQQVLNDTDEQHLSGGERVNQALSRALTASPDLLLLDEPTNHLDNANRRSLTRMLQHYAGSIVVVTHDEILINQVCDTIWHIEKNNITVFQGSYTDYLAEQTLQRDALEKKLIVIKRAQYAAHAALMREQERASHARQRGINSVKNRKWPTIKSPTKLSRGNTTTGRKQAEIREQRHDLVAQLNQLPSVDIIQPCFHLRTASFSQQTVLQISNGVVGYNKPLVSNIYLSLSHGERVALVGKNGSGKTTLARAIAGQNSQLILSGDWFTPPAEKIGYLDQHYGTLDPQQTVIKSLSNVAPDWTPLELRRHLSDFLFRQNEQIQSCIAQLSGGEKARLALACIAARPPQLLILDEVTNNLDRRMRQHVIEILRQYPGALLLISHDEDFLEQVGNVQRYIQDNSKDWNKN